jgi:hypothetical protein
MNGEMKKCLFQGEQEKCSDYKAKSEKHGHVDLTCLWFMRDFLGKGGDGSICRLPPPRIKETP